MRTPITITTETPRLAAPGGGVPQLLRLLHLASPALPIGAFHFSAGMEFAVEAGWIRDEASALEWIDGVARGGLATLDLPVLHRLRGAWEAAALEDVRRWNSLLIAARETSELRAEDRHLGAALLRVLAELEVDTRAIAGLTAGSEGTAHATVFALACARWQVDALSTLQAYAWSWVENQMLAAVKLVPLGQSAGQRMLHALNGQLATLTRRACDFADSDIGMCSLGQALASARHERQYTRLFRS